MSGTSWRMRWVAMATALAVALTLSGSPTMTAAAEETPWAHVVQPDSQSAWGWIEDEAKELLAERGVTDERDRDRRSLRGGRIRVGFVRLHLLGGRLLGLRERCCQTRGRTEESQRDGARQRVILANHDLPYEFVVVGFSCRSRGC